MDLIKAMTIIKSKVWYGDFKSILELLTYGYVLADLRKLANTANIDYQQLHKLAIKSQLMGAFAPIWEIKDDRDFIEACDLIADMISRFDDDDTRRILLKLLLAFYVDDFS